MLRSLALVFALAPLGGCMGCHTVEPGSRGVALTWGVPSETTYAPGFHWEGPGEDIVDVSVRQQKREVLAPCFSSDLQEIQVKIAVLYRIPDAKVVKVFTDFAGEPFDVLVAPRVQESVKEATSSRTAEAIVKDREKVKVEALAATRAKVGDILVVEDIVIEDIGLSKTLSAAIEAKMVQQQEAAKSEFTRQKAEIDAKVEVERAKGEAEATLTRARAEAESIRIRGEALRQNAGVVELQLIEKWNGAAPQIVAGAGSGVTLLLPATR